MSTSQSQGFTKFSASFVDESLFGARKVTREHEEPLKDFDPPWIRGKDNSQQRNRPLLFYCPSLATLTTTPLATANRVQTTPKLNSRPPTATNKKHPIKFSPSYIDESLFKSPRQSDEKQPNFEPPWSGTKTNRTPRPILWDYSGGRPSSCGTNRSVTSESQKNGRTDRMGQKKGTQGNVVDNRRPWR